jgi:hypothetical protein
MNKAVMQSDRLRLIENVEVSSNSTPCLVINNIQIPIFLPYELLNISSFFKAFDVPFICFVPPSYIELWHCVFYTVEIYSVCAS